MDERSGNRIRLAVLKIKTHINVYRCLTFVFFVLSLKTAVFYVISNRNITEPMIAFLVSASFLLLTVFMDKLVYVLNLPTNYLLITEEEIVYQRRKKQFVFGMDEITYKFHPFYEDFQTVSLLEIVSDDVVLYIPITKKQFFLLEEYLRSPKAPIS